MTQPNDPTIAPDTPLYRRLHPKQVVWDESRKRVRATRDAFKDDDLSVALGDEMHARQLTPSCVLRIDPLHQLACFTAGFARSEAQAVWRDPLVGHERYGDDPTHGIVGGSKPGSRRRRFVDASEILIFNQTGLSADVQAQFDGSGDV